MLEFLNQLFPLAIAATIPIMITAIGGLYSERSGVVNIGLEGLMVIGAFASAITVYIFDQGGNSSEWIVWISILIAAIMGGLFATLHAFASVSLKANQVISGTAINMLAASITVFFARFLTGSQNITLYNRAQRYGKIPVLGKLPLLGNWFFTDAYLTSFFVIIIAVLTWYVIFKTSYGLRLRACGEFPQSADSAGVSVVRMRYQAVILSGVFAGIGGAIFTLTNAGEFSGTVSGLGFLALAALIFGKWKPINVIGTTFFFGFMRTLSQLATINDTLKSFQIPSQFYNALPYVMTLVALVVVSRNAAAPKALGEPYDAGKR